ncbi:molybdenum cofactor biosynthesis protein MoeA [Rhodococcus pyridinivorans KG-16]|uniref:Molybdopterin molybdenumtransferase n=1 Tax=Rhodococcus pyridinivorans KG-16 TaxID=1441730 RepID=A0A0V9UMR7_9NOCA|nr:gephyrin-like molybdotransferase Glp [Rhodococcus pyridinivorans]KSZ59282.1 molybdenum cofactor biosynthesis protein MoeA [Rhodococcus pyridinivorans KG-16]
MTSGRRSVEEHEQHVAALLDPLRKKSPLRAPLAHALHRTLAEDIESPLDLPPFRNSQMDGYAVRAGDLASTPTDLPVQGVLAAGDTVAALEPGHALKIMTGAPVPDGADAVVPVEDTHATTPDSDGAGTVTVERSVTPGTYVREAGTDVRKGDLLLPAGTVLAARHIAALAAVGLTSIPVRARPRVAIISTGSELVTAGSELGPGQIFNSNGPALAASASANGADVVTIDHCHDDPEEFVTMLEHAVGVADVVFTSGGVSKGDFEVVKDTLAPRGGQFVSVAMQPGGPQGTAVVDGVPILTFPGNPVSALVSFEVFARPALRAAAGYPPVVCENLPLTTDLTSIPGRRQFLRGRLDENGVTPFRGHGSHLVAGLAAADVLLDIPADITSLEAGDLVKVRIL